MRALCVVAAHGFALAVLLVVGLAPAAGAGAPLSLTSTGRDSCSPERLEAPAGEVAVTFTNPTDRQQSFGLVGVGEGSPSRVRRGETSSLTAVLAAGTYTFWCGDDADDEDAMRGTLVVSGAGGGTAPPPSPSPPGSAPATAELILREYGFSPSSLTVSAGTVTVTVRNVGGDVHTWTVPGLVNVTVQPGETKTATFQANAGSYPFFCAVGGHMDKGMRGTLTVVGASGPAPGPAPPPATPPPAAPGTLAVTVSEFAFAPSSLAAAAGPVTLSVTNRGDLPHTFTIDGLVDLEVAPGRTATATFNAAPGTYRIYCAVSGHRDAGMSGTLVVSSGGTTPSAAPPPAAPPARPAEPPGNEAAQGHHHGTTATPPRPAALPRGCRPKPTLRLAGPVSAASARSLTFRVRTTNRAARVLRGRRVAVVLHARTAYVAVGAPALGRIRPGHRVTVRAGRCGTRMLVAVSVAVRPQASTTSTTPATGTTLVLRADRTGFPRFDTKELRAPAGRITLRLVNPSPVPHNVAIEGRGAGKPVANGGTSTVTATLAPGRYTVLCSMPGHAGAGMKGVLIVERR